MISIDAGDPVHIIVPPCKDLTIYAQSMYGHGEEMAEYIDISHCDRVIIEEVIERFEDIMIFICPMTIDRPVIFRTTRPYEGKLKRLEPRTIMLKDGTPYDVGVTYEISFPVNGILDWDCPDCIHQFIEAK